jgi:ketosteroid isomerase-like protein
MPNDETLIERLFEDGDRALISAEVAELQRIYAEDYEQHDGAGNRTTRDDLIRKLASGEIRFVSMKSTRRTIRKLRNDVAVVNGSEEDEVERGGKRTNIGYVYMDVVMKRDGRWQIVASQLAAASQI